MTNSDLVLAGDLLVKKYDAVELKTKANFIEALSNKWFRLNALYRIKNKKGKRVRFMPNKAQRDFFTSSHNRDLVLKARQRGITSFEMISCLDDCLFIVNINAGCIAHTLPDAKDIFRNKIKFAYEQIPESWLAIFDNIGLAFPLPTSDKGEAYVFDNGSSIQVSTGYRGGTLQRLHVSEFGKICRMYPEKAEEIVSGAFEALDASCRIVVESTAEGQEGRFFEYCQQSENMALAGSELTTLDFKFHFFPWWDDDDYCFDEEQTKKVVITSAMSKYFSSVERQVGRKLTAGQKAWYVKKEAVLKDKMKREYPALPKEAFEQAIDGAYYADQMADCRKEGRIRKVPYDPKIPVHAFFDLGRNDSMAIWFMQSHYDEMRFIRYHEDSGYSMQHYLKYMQKLGYVFGDIYLPHDGAVVDLTQAENLSRADVVRAAGFRVVVVPRVPAKMDAIQAVRDSLPLCWFDEQNCSHGIKHLDNYKKDWDSARGVYKDRPRHDSSSHGNDSFEQFARGFRPTTSSRNSFEPDWN